ncbi:MAG: tetratricopeptide repeat protein [Ktedonobacterales bacterium]
MGTPGDTAAAPAPRSPYPRAWWLALPRFLLVLVFLGGSPLYPVVLIQAIIRHTLLTTDRTLIDPRTLLWYIPLTLAGGWAFLDALREGKVLHARRMAELREPPDRSWQRKLVAARAKGDRQAELKALGAIGFFLKMRGHYDEAKPYLEEALSLARAMGNQLFEEERALYGLGQAAFERRDRDTAEDLLRECLAVVTTLDRRDEIAEKYAHVGEFLCEYRGKREEGCQMLAQAQAIYHEIGQSSPRWLDEEQHMRDLRRKYGDESV